MGEKHFKEYSKWSNKVSSWAKLFGSMLRALSLNWGILMYFAAVVDV